MNKQTAVPIAKGIIKHFFKIKSQYSSGGGTTRSRYCYSVWMRHLHHWSIYNKGMPKIVAELGPGNSLGIGFSALLSGSEQLHTLDVVKYWDKDRNLRKFNDLVKLFKQQIEVPDENEFPRIIPSLNNYSFPSEILTEEILQASLNEDRLNAIRAEILDLGNPNNTYINCHVPWNDSEIIAKASVDFIYSQSVLQYIDDLDGTFRIMKKWLKPDGLMSHSIDLSSIGITKNWNSHWTFSDFEWEMIKSGRDFIITRLPFSEYEKKHLNHGFKILESIPVKRENKLKSDKLVGKFKNLSENDLMTSEAYILSRN